MPPIGPPDPDFDWRWYVSAYADLTDADITDEESAWEHFARFGRAESRRPHRRRAPGFDWLSHVDRFADQDDAADPDTFLLEQIESLAQSSESCGLRRSPKMGMLCPSADSLFLRSWGDLVCWDDAGSEHVLQEWDPQADVAEAYLHGPYEAIREDLWQGTMPRPSECEKCLLLRTRAVASSAPADLRFVRMVRVEPSYRCTLDCPGCVPLEIRKGHRKSFDLDPAILEKVLSDLQAADIDVHAVDFQGHGEPLLNPRLAEMVALSRRLFPAAWISITTNAHGKVKPALLEARPSEIICAIDGATPETYAKYRVHGRFALAWSFLEELAKRAKDRNPHIRVVWKYVLFEHNSSPEELLLAQEMARNAGVAELVFVFTRNGPPPQQIRHPSQIPRLQNGPRLGFRFHEPSLDDFEFRLDEMSQHLEEGDPILALPLAASLVSGFERFFPEPQILPAAYRALLERAYRQIQTVEAHQSAGIGARIESLIGRSGEAPRGLVVLGSPPGRGLPLGTASTREGSEPICQEG